jgi:hypothetical protein
MSIEPEGWYMDTGPPSWDAEAKTFSFFLHKQGRERVLCILAIDGWRTRPSRATFPSQRRCIEYLMHTGC